MSDASLARGFWYRVAGPHAFSWQLIVFMSVVAVPLTPAIYGAFGSDEYKQAFWVCLVAQVLALIPILLFGRAVVAIEKFGTRLAMVVTLFVVINGTRAVANGALLSLWGIDAPRYGSRIFSNVCFATPIMITIAWLTDHHYENRQSVKSLREACYAANLRIDSLIEALAETFSFWNRELHLETTESRTALLLIADQEFQNRDRVDLIGQIDAQLAGAETAAQLYWTNGSGLAPSNERSPEKYTFREVLDGSTTYRPVAPGMTAFGIFAVTAAWQSFIISRGEALLVSSIIGVMAFAGLGAYRRYLLPIVVKQSPTMRWVIFEISSALLTIAVVIFLKSGLGVENPKLIDPRIQFYLVVVFLNVVALYGGIMYGSMLYLQRLEVFKAERLWIIKDLERELDLQNSLSKLLFTRVIVRTPTAATIRLQEAIAINVDEQIEEALNETLSIWTDTVSKLSMHPAAPSSR